MSARATIALAFLTMAAAAVVNAASGPQAADVAIVDQTLPILVAGDNGIVNGSVFVSNAADGVRIVDVMCVLRSATGDVISAACGGSSEVPGKTAALAIPFSVPLPMLSSDAYPIDGWIAARAAPGASDSVNKASAWSKPVALTIKAGRTTGQDWMLFRFAAIAAGVLVCVAGLFGVLGIDRGVLLQRMGTPTWTFTDSWSSTVTIAGAIVTSILSVAGLPDQGHTLSRATYGIASALSTAFIGLAPGIYNLFRVPIPAPPGGAPVKYRGFVIMFLIAAIFTLTGALAQFGLLRLVCRDLAAAGIIAEALARVLAGLWWALQAATLVYAGVSIIQTLKTQADVGVAAPKQFMMRAPAADQRPLPSWPLL